MMKLRDYTPPNTYLYDSETFQKWNTKQDGSGNTILDEATFTPSAKSMIFL